MTAPDQPSEAELSRHLPPPPARSGLAGLFRTLDAALRARDQPEHTAEATEAIKRVVRSMVDGEVVRDRPELAGAAQRVLEAAPESFDQAAGALVTLMQRYVNAHAKAGGFRVLIVEDDPAAAQVLKSTLGWTGHQVVVAGTAREARRELQSTPFDLIVLDLLLPDGDGRNILLEIRSSLRLSATPVFVASAKLGAQTRGECFALGADAYFEKPVDLEAFAIAVESRLVRQTYQRHRSRRDQVTGLPNRAAFIEYATSVLAERKELPQTLAILDLDHFGWVEETWGRQAAEGLLRRIGIRLAMSLRPASCFARWDGAEFVALFERKSVGEVASFLEQALAGLRRIDFRHESSPSLHITFSAGVTNLEAGQPVVETLATADRLCFIAKSSGRNRVVSDEGGTVPLPTRRVLLAEDDPSVRELLTRQLRREGFEIMAYPDGAAALQAAPSLGASLVITDIQMPELDGLGLLRGLREHSTTRHLPVMILSAMGDENHIVHAFELGADDYVLKPFAVREVTARLRRLLRRPTLAGMPLAPA